VGTLASPDIDVGQDLVELLLGGLRADHRLHVQRMAGLDTLDARHGSCNELLIDRFLNEDAGRTCADLALVE
jgi:hypothetical protein